MRNAPQLNRAEAEGRFDRSFGQKNTIGTRIEIEKVEQIVRPRGIAISSYKIRIPFDRLVEALLIALKQRRHGHLLH